MKLILYETGKAAKPTSRKEKVTTSNGNNHPALGEEDLLCTSWGTATREEWPKAILGINERKQHRHSEHTDWRTGLTQSGVLEPRGRGSKHS